MRALWLGPIFSTTVLLATAAQSPAPESTVEVGPKPTSAEATQYVKIWTEQVRMGPRTKFAKVQVVKPVRWHVALTARWPAGKDGSTLEGWLITFEEMPNLLLNPYGKPKPVELLVDRDQVVHWRTQTEWESRNRDVRH